MALCIILLLTKKISSYFSFEPPLDVWQDGYFDIREVTTLFFCENIFDTLRHVHRDLESVSSFLNFSPSFILDCRDSTQFPFYSKFYFNMVNDNYEHEINDIISLIFFGMRYKLNKYD